VGWGIKKVWKDEKSHPVAAKRRRKGEEEISVKGGGIIERVPNKIGKVNMRHRDSGDGKKLKEPEEKKNATSDLDDHGERDQGAEKRAKDRRERFRRGKKGKLSTTGRKELETGGEGQREEGSRNQSGEGHTCKTGEGQSCMTLREKERRSDSEQEGPRGGKCRIEIDDS